MDPKDFPLDHTKKGRNDNDAVHAGSSPLQEGSLPADSGERDGIGSTYGGTQTPDPQAPDGYQKPRSGDAAGRYDLPPDDSQLGKEYEAGDSYGQQDAPANTSGSADGSGDTGSDAAGTPIRHAK